MQADGGSIEMLCFRSPMEARWIGALLSVAIQTKEATMEKLGNVMIFVW